MITPTQAVATDLSSTALTNCAAAMAMHVGRIDDNSNGNWFEFYDDGTTNGYKRGACHGSLQQRDVALVGTMSPWTRIRYASYVDHYSSAGYKKPISRALANRWYDWLLNRSWAAPYIIAESLEFARDVGFMIDGRIPGNFVLALCTMSRHAGEQMHNVSRMFDYVDEFGVSEDLAFFLAFGVGTTNKYGGIIWGHNLFKNDHGASALAVWMKRDIKSKSGPFRDGGSKTGVNAMWGPSERVGVVKSYERYKAKVEAGSVVIPNPFKPVVKATGVMTEDFLRSIIPNLKDKFDAPTSAVSTVDNPREAVRRAA